MSQEFIKAFNALQADAHYTMRLKGWWHSRDRLEKLADIDSALVGKFAQVSNQISCLMLVVTELAEAVEAIRHGNPPDDKIPNFSGAEAELADVILRIMDMSEAYGWRVAEAIVAKAEMNKGRSHMHGGKKA